MSYEAETNLQTFLTHNFSVSQENEWALLWLRDSLSSDAERCSSFVQEITQELENTTGVQASLDNDSVLELYHLSGG